MKYRGGHRRVFQETTQGAGAVEKVGINWDYPQKVTHAIDEMYSIQLFGNENMINLEEKADTDKTWETRQSYFMELYTKQNRYNKAIGKKSVLKARQT